MDTQKRRRSDLNKIAYAVIIFFIVGGMSWAGMTMLNTAGRVSLVEKEIELVKIKFDQHCISTKEVEDVKEKGVLFRIKNIERDVADMKKSLDNFLRGKYEKVYR